MNPYWTVVQTAAARESATADSLQRIGFATYLPRTTVRDRNHAIRTVPLFPSYLFVRVTARWTPITATVGVIRLLRSGEAPARLPDRVLLDLQAREVNGIVQLPPLRRGQAVRLIRGAFRGQLAIYQGMSGRARERVLLTLLGRQVSTVIRVGDAVAY
jgi:transcription antitermination factor NusG